MQQLVIESKILIFKILAISKIVHLSLVREMQSSKSAQLDKIQKEFIWRDGNPKLKHATVCND